MFIVLDSDVCNSSTALWCVDPRRVVTIMFFQPDDVVTEVRRRRSFEVYDNIVSFSSLARPGTPWRTITGAPLLRGTSFSSIMFSALMSSRRPQLEKLVVVPPWRWDPPEAQKVFFSVVGSDVGLWFSFINDVTTLCGCVLEQEACVAVVRSVCKIL